MINISYKLFEVMTNHDHDHCCNKKKKNNSHMKKLFETHKKLIAL